MKKSVPKGDKKRKKEVTAETSRLEQELKEKHEEEMRSMEASDVGNKLSEGVGAGGGEEKDEGLVKVDDEDKPVKKSRAQKRKVCPLLFCCHHILSSHTLTHLTGEEGTAGAGETESEGGGGGGERNGTSRQPTTQREREPRISAEHSSTHHH